MDVSSEHVHRLADTTYRNVEELAVDLKGLVTAAKIFHKAMQNVVSTSQHFFTIMESIGAKAAYLPGSVRKLGDCMKEMVSGYEQINSHHGNWIQSLNTDFIVPLETKLEGEAKTFTGIRKTYKQENAKRQALVEKTSGKLKSIQKKRNPSRSQIEKEGQLKQVLSDQTEELQSTRVEGLRKALIEERKMYCFVVDHFCSVLHNQIAYNAMSHQVLSTRVTDWSSLCSTPNELPAESSILLVDPRSPRAFSSSTPGERLSRELQHGNHPDGATPLQRTGSGSASGRAAQGRIRSRRVSCRVRALYPHQSSASGQLEFNAGDLIDAIDDPQDGWQFGENTKSGSSGWFPVQYVDKIWPTPEPRHKRRDSAQLSVGGGSGSSLLHVRSPTIPERDYQGMIPAWSGSAGQYGDQGLHGSSSGMSRKSSQSSVTSPGYKQ